MKNYTEYDYDQLVQRMTDYLSEAEGWGEGYQSSTGQTLIQLMADVTDHLHYMLERRTNENYLETATMRSSIITRACELGYRYRRAKANVGEVRISIKDVEVDEEMFAVMADSDITIPRFTKVSFDGKDFYTLQTVTIPTGENYTTARVIQGTLVDITRPLSSANDVLILDYEMIDDRSIIISEGGEVFGDVVYDIENVNRRSLSFCTPTDAFYDIKYNVEGMRIVFGDGVYGKKPTSDVSIQYIQVDDSESIVGTGREFDITGGTLTDVNGMTYDVEVFNTTAIRGYLPPEDDMSIKRNATTYHKTNGRAVTNDDYAYWMGRSNVVNIADSKAFGEQELETLMYNLNNVYITYLKEDGSDLTTEEHRNLRNFMNTVKTSQAHIVFRNADKLFLQALLAFKKHPNTPITDSEAYDIAVRFLTNYFALREGSIGKGVQSSDMIRDFYKETVVRNGITYPVIDYAKIKLNGMIPLEYPPRTSKALVSLNNPTIDDDKEFILTVGNLVNLVRTDSTDTMTDVLTKMRDEVIRNTPFDARVIASGIAYDAYGNPLPIEINPALGATMLIGVDTSYENPVSVIDGAAVGSTLAGVKTFSPEFTVNHFYYSSRAGRRPMIPMRNGTTVSFQAPSDVSGVNVYTRIDKDDPESETLLTTIQPNDMYTETFTGIHTLQFEYLNDSYEDRTVEITYPEFDGVSIGMEISSRDGFLTFNVITSSGDYSSDVTVDYIKQLPIQSRDFSGRVNNILPSSVRITDQLERVKYRDNGSGYLINQDTGLLTTEGRISYITGEVVLPEDMVAGDYLMFYDQDEFSNFTVNNNTAIQLLQPKQHLTEPAETLSRIRLA